MLEIEAKSDANKHHRTGLLIITAINYQLCDQRRRGGGGRGAATGTCISLTPTGIFGNDIDFSLDTSTLISHRYTSVISAPLMTGIQWSRTIDPVNNILWTVWTDPTYTGKDYYFIIAKVMRYVHRWWIDLAKKSSSPTLIDRVWRSIINKITQYYKYL